jgi:hypothetical protein
MGPPQGGPGAFAVSEAGLPAAGGPLPAEGVGSV